MSSNPSCIGVTGKVTVATRGVEGPGEVLLRLQGGTEAYIAWSETPLSLGTQVVVYNNRGGRTVDVMELRP